MLRRFVYLDAPSLSGYVTALEGGLVTESTRRTMRSGSAGAGVKVSAAQASGEKAKESEESQTLTDTDGAKFERLLRAAAVEPEALGWVEVTQPDTDYEGIGIGAMVHWECDIFVPEAISALARSGEALAAIEMIRTVAPAARRLGLDTTPLPGDDELTAASDMLSGMNASLVVVGEDEDTDWRVAGQLTGDVRLEDLDGRARIVGKVSKVIRRGRWTPFLSFPGVNLGSRAQRRELEKQRPEPGKEGNYLAGPALRLDILAIYR